MAKQGLDFVRDEALVVWRRLDAPGHDACRLSRASSGWTLDGAAVFVEDGVPARLDYHLACDDHWRTQHGEIRGWIGARAVEFHIVHTNAGSWLCNESPVAGLSECVDLDLGFTPATNLFQLRRLALAVGRAADAPVAWLDASAGTLDLLLQRYERRSESSYWYESPRFNYAALLEVSDVGFVYRYPELWQMES